MKLRVLSDVYKCIFSNERKKATCFCFTYFFIKYHINIEVGLKNDRFKGYLMLMIALKN